MDGNSLNVKGRAEVEFTIGNQKLIHTFYVTQYITQSVILGRDFLKEHHANLRFDQCCLELNGEAIPLEENNYIASLVKVVNNITICPQSVVTCHAKGRGQKFRDCKGDYLVSAINTGAIGEQPGLTLANSLVNLKCLFVWFNGIPTHKGYPMPINKKYNNKKGLQQ